MVMTTERTRSYRVHRPPPTSTAPASSVPSVPSVPLPTVPEPPIPLPWYDDRTYQQIRALMKDGEFFAESYAAWEADARRTEAFFAAKGEKTLRVYLEPATFERWCAAHGHQADARGRVAYGQWVARRGRGDDGAA